VGDYGLLREADFVREKEERGWTELPKKIRSPVNILPAIM